MRLDSNADAQYGSLGGMLETQAARLGDQLAVADCRRRLTYAELNEAVGVAGRAALAHGLLRGDRFAVWAPNSVEWVVATLGCVSVGGILVPVSTRLKSIEAADILRRSRPRLVFATGDFLGSNYVSLLSDMELSSPAPTVIDIRPSRAPEPGSFAAFLDTATTVSTEAHQRATSEVTSDDIADMLFTSGTTGFPKGVLAAHSQVLRGSDLYFQSIGVREGDRVLCINPLFHAFGYKGALLGSLLRGASVYFEETFDADRALELIETERISVLPAPPTVFSDLIAHPSRHRTDLSSLRAAATGGTMVPPALVRSIGSELGCETITTAYGQTEAPTIVCMTTDDRPEDISEWAGRALPGLEVRVVDDAGRPVATGEPGEILARGFIVMKGYFEDEEATAKTIDADGWLHTGDVGVFRDDGLLKITDRKKDMFIVGGLNVYPAEVEAIMSADPRIAELAIVGTSDERLGEVGAAFVVPAAGERLGPDDVIAIARERVANYKVPRYAEIVTNLPRNAAGKVVKVGLRARAAAMSGAAAESAADDTHSTPRD